MFDSALFQGTKVILLDETFILTKPKNLKKYPPLLIQLIDNSFRPNSLPFSSSSFSSFSKRSRRKEEEKKRKSQNYTTQKAEDGSRPRKSIIHPDVLIRVHGEEKEPRKYASARVVGCAEWREGGAFIREFIIKGLLKIVLHPVSIPVGDP